MNSPATTKVLFLMNSLAMGGTERKVVNIANRFAAEGLAVTCVYLREPDSLRTRLDPRVQVEFMRRTARVPLEVLLRLLHLHRARRFTTVIAVNLYPTLLLAPLVATGKLPGVQCISLMNTSSQPRLRDKLAGPLHAWSLGRMHTVVYGSESQRKFWVSEGSAQWARSLVIYNGVDIERFVPASAAVRAGARAVWNIPEGRVVLGSVGRMVPEKNQAALIEAASRIIHCNPHVLLAGDGPLRTGLDALAAKHGMTGRVTFTGALMDVRPALQAMDIFVLPSTAVETFSNAALEAMASGVPVVLTDVGGGAEMVRDQIDGYVIPRSGASDELAPPLERLSRDAALRNQMGSAARVRTVTSFSSDSMFPRYRFLLR